MAGELLYDDGQVKLYRGDCRDVLPDLGVVADACVTDPPYQSTRAHWDVWPDGWVAAVAAALPTSSSLWCFGTMRLFLQRRDEFLAAGFKYAEDDIPLLWEKHNATGAGKSDRLAVVHEWGTHWYRGRWSDLHHNWERVPRDHDEDKTVRRVEPPPHRRGDYGAHHYVDDGLRQPKSVRYVKAPSVRFKARHQDEKPVPVMLAPARACVPPGGTLLDPFAGSGTTGEVARLLGIRAVLLENDPAACEVIITRLSESLPTAGPAADPGDTTVTALPPTPTADQQQLALVEGA